MSRAAVRMLLALAACPSARSETDDTDACEVVLLDVYPSNGMKDAYYRGRIEVTFLRPDDTAEITITGPSGDLGGDVAWRGRTRVFTPSTPLDPGTDYAVAVDSCSGHVETTFTTSATGDVVDAGVGDTYALDVARGRFAEPEGVGTFVGRLLEQGLLVGVVSVEGSRLALIGTPSLVGATPPSQDPCTLTTEFPTADFAENPYVGFGPWTTRLSTSGGVAVIRDAWVTGAFTPDGSAMEGAELAGQLDTRYLGAHVDPGNPTEGALCELSLSIGVPCSPCGDGKVYCLDLLVDRIPAVRVPDVSLVPVLEIPPACPD